jgi:hypothetical protein
MKSILSLSTLVITSLFLSMMPAQAETACAPPDGKAAGAAAEEFFAGYLKALDDKSPDGNVKWVVKTKLAAPEFKAAFKKAMNDKELESDPVIFAQDVPITPFKAESVKVKGDNATVVVVARYNPKETSTIKVSLVAKDGHWLVAKVAQGKYSLGTHPG